MLTIKNPWATLIVNNIKHYEFRTWKTKYRGKFYIHSSINNDKNSIGKFKKYNLDYIDGAIIGEAEIVDCIFVSDDFKNKLLNENSEVYKNSSGYAFVLKNIKKYDKPIYCKGKLGFWEYDI